MNREEEFDRIPTLESIDHYRTFPWFTLWLCSVVIGIVAKLAGAPVSWLYATAPLWGAIVLALVCVLLAAIVIGLFGLAVTVADKLKP